MKTTLALVLGIVIGASGEFIGFAKAEKPKALSVSEQMCQVLVLNHIVRNCHYFEQK